MTLLKTVIIDVNRAHPEWTARQIANFAGCSASYVRETRARCSLTYALDPTARFPRTAPQLRAAAARLIAKAQILENKG